MKTNTRVCLEKQNPRKICTFS